MKFKQVVVFMAAILFAATAYSGDEGHHKMEIKVVVDGGDGETRIVIDSDDLGFDLHDMQIGENHSIVDKEGRSILVTRVEDGLTFEVDGKTIEMPLFGGDDGMHVWAAAADVDHVSDIDVHVMHVGMTADAMAMDGVMIFSGKEIDEATQQVIRVALESAGHENVRFAGGDDGGPHHVRVIKKLHEIREVSE